MKMKFEGVEPNAENWKPKTENSIMNRIFRGTIVVAICAAGTAANGALMTYDFESLTSGTLIGQDNWIGGYLLGTPAAVASGTVVDLTQVATIASDSAEHLLRANNGGFSFPAFSGLETDAVVQFDFRWNRADDANGIRLGIGRDLNSDALTFGGEGVGLRYQDGGFEIEHAGVGQQSLNPAPESEQAMSAIGTDCGW